MYAVKSATYTVRTVQACLRSARSLAPGVWELNILLLPFVTILPGEQYSSNAKRSHIKNASSPQEDYVSPNTPPVLWSNDCKSFDICCEQLSTQYPHPFDYPVRIFKIRNFRPLTELHVKTKYMLCCNCSSIRVSKSAAFCSNLFSFCVT